MQGDTQVIAYLNQMLRNELTAINQYFLHSKMFANWGFSKLANKEHEESIDEMKHAEMLITRILFLQGLPIMQDLGKIFIGNNAKEALEYDLKLEQQSRTLIQTAISYTESVQDFVTRELIKNILESEEGHIDWLETQIALINTIGLENYLQLQV